MSTFIWPPVSVTTLPPMGGATSANQLLEIAELQAIKLAVQSLANRTFVQNLFFDYQTTPVSDLGWQQLIAATVDEIKHLTLFDSGGFTMEIGIGAAAAEVRLFLVPPGGFNGELPFPIPAGSRVSVRCVQAQTVNTGLIVANFLK